MKLREFSVHEFRSIWNSGSIKVDDSTTCLVGKNESGKTALLTALYRTNPIIPSDAKFHETYDYPKREVEDYRFAVDNGDRTEAVIVTCLWELDDSDLEAVSSKFGTSALEERQFRRDTYYGKQKSCFNLSVNDAQARHHLANNSAFPDDLKDALNNSKDWEEFLESLKTSGEIEAVSQCIDLVSQIAESGLDHYIFNSIIWPRAPKFLYFDEYYQMTGRENLNALIEREDEGDLLESDRPLLGLIGLARLIPRELIETKNTTELKNRLEGASNYLTRRIIKYWSQNKHVQMKFDVRDAKPEDPEGMRDGINIWGEVHDTVHWAHTPLGSRSRGFVWFFSFLAWYEDVKRKKQNVILLLDEPGLSLHGKAQQDLLVYFEQELAQHQLIYSTHSPFMIDPDNFERVRIVQDLGIDSNEQLPKEQDGTKVLANVFDATEDSLFPLQGALGYEIHQTLFVGPNTLVVEGASDMLYLRAISAELDREGRTSLSEKWIITPVGGSGKVPTFVALLAPQRGMNVVTLLDVQAKERPMIEELYKKKLLQKKKVLMYADFVTQEQADIEDLFDRRLYVDLLNAEYREQMVRPIEDSELNEREPRVLKAIERVLDDNPLKYGKFGHYRPARYLVENIAKIWPELSGETKDKFEAIFKKLNSLLKK